MMMMKCTSYAEAHALMRQHNAHKRTRKNRLRLMTDTHLVYKDGVYHVMYKYWRMRSETILTYHRNRRNSVVFHLPQSRCINSGTTTRMTAYSNCMVWVSRGKPHISIRKSNGSHGNACYNLVDGTTCDAAALRLWAPDGTVLEEWHRRTHASPMYRNALYAYLKGFPRRVQKYKYIWQPDSNPPSYTYLVEQFTFEEGESKCWVCQWKGYDPSPSLIENPANVRRPERSLAEALTLIPKDHPKCTQAAKRAAMRKMKEVMLAP